MTQQRNFGAHLASISQARRFVRAAAADAGADPDTAELLVSELATNAVVHANSDFHVRVSRDGTTLRVEVANTEPELLPTFNAPSDSGGRGLGLLESMALNWGTESRPNDKIVWFEMPTS